VKVEQQDVSPVWNRSFFCFKATEDYRRTLEKATIQPKGLNQEQQKTEKTERARKFMYCSYLLWAAGPAAHRRWSRIKIDLRPADGHGYLMKIEILLFCR
jgi:hypothetical protein